MKNQEEEHNLKLVQVQNCKHESFETHSKVGRLTETDGGPVTGFTFECKVMCTQCKTFFEFIGVPGGMSPREPRTNFDFTELRAPIRPYTGEMQSSVSYEVKGPAKTDSKNIN